MFDTPPDENAPTAFPAPAVVTAAVTEAPAPSLPAAFTDSTLLGLLARELAIDINEKAIILKHFNLTDEQFALIEKNPQFQLVLETERATWNSATSAAERLKLKAQAILEEALPTLGARMMKKEEALPAVAETGKLMAKIAGMDNRMPGEQGEKVSIKIVIGQDELAKDVTPVVKQIEGSA